GRNRVQRDGVAIKRDQLHIGAHGTRRLHQAQRAAGRAPHLHNLRRKLGRHIVETVRGVGYRLGDAELLAQDGRP
ncbi:MAG: hypothetical protein PF501_01785, partial [Salinisphaera sp.]|nr:hypothetical protein [Salinisphaera sp.]